MLRVPSLVLVCALAVAGLAGCAADPPSSGATGSGGTSGSGGSTASGGTTGSGGTTATGGATGSGGSASGGSAGSGGASGALPRLTVMGTKLTDPSGKTVILRGSSMIDIGSLYAYNGSSAAGIERRIDKVVAAGLQGHVVRMPVYPQIAYNGGSPYCAPLPYPVGTGPSATCTPTPSLSATDYDDKVLKVAVDYATSKGLYVIIDYHQIDNATKGTSAADATTFWTDVAPRFASYPNVFFEPFNEPIDTSAAWTALKPVVQGWIDTIRAGAPDNIIIVPSMSYDQRPGDAASDPPTGTNLMYTAHIYPVNWSSSFMAQVTTAVAKAPVFVTEWGFDTSNTADASLKAMASWGTALQGVLDGNGASWTAWVSDNGWGPPLFADSALTQPTDFGMLVQGWLAAKATSDWIQ